MNQEKQQPHTLPGRTRWDPVRFFCRTAAFNRFTSFTCLLFTDRNSQYWRGIAPDMVEGIPPLDGRISPLWWKDFLPDGGRISRPIVEGNWESWKVFPVHRGRISPEWWKEFPLPRVAMRAQPPTTSASR
jgi:hypothetical protein